MKALKQKVATLFQGGFVRSVSVLAGGTAFSQLIALLALPILTRLYSPNDFGVLAVYISLVALIASVACLRFEIAIPIAKKDEDAFTLLAISLFSVIIVSLLTIIGLIVFADQFNKATQSKLSGYVWLIPLSIFFSGLYAALQYWAIRHKAFSLIAKTRMNQALSGSGTQLGLGYLGVTPLGLVFGQLLNAGAGIFGLSRYLAKNHLKLLKRINLRRIKKVFKEYDRFPKYSTWEAFANSGAIQIPVILIAYFAISSEAGFLMLAMRLLAAPMALIGGAVGQVYLAEASKKYHQGTLQEFTHKTIWTLLKVGAPPLLFAGLFSPLFISLIFGAEWKRTGVLIAWMAPWFLMQFITSPISMAMHITNNQKIAMVLQFFGLFLRAGGVLIAGLYFTEYVAEVYAITGFGFYIIYLSIVLSVLRQNSESSTI